MRDQTNRDGTLAMTDLEFKIGQDDLAKARHHGITLGVALLSDPYCAGSDRGRRSTLAAPRRSRGSAARTSPCGYPTTLPWRGALHRPGSVCAGRSCRERVE